MPRLGTGRAAFTARRGMVPLDVQHRWQAARLLGNITDEPARLLFRGATEIIEMIGSASQTCTPCRAPVGLELRVQVIAPFCGLDPREGHARRAHLTPVYIALIARHIDAMDRIAPWRAPFPVVGVIVAVFRIGRERRIGTRKSGINHPLDLPLQRRRRHRLPRCTAAGGQRREHPQTNKLMKFHIYLPKKTACLHRAGDREILQCRMPNRVRFPAR